MLLMSQRFSEEVTSFYSGRSLVLSNKCHGLIAMIAMFIVARRRGCYEGSSPMPFI
ncbi:hypothetical protein BgiBS90_009521, partial [Biomphalaria glabrata]